MVPYPVPPADVSQEMFWLGGWSSPVAARSTVAYHDGSGYDAA